MGATEGGLTPHLSLWPGYTDLELVTRDVGAKLVGIVKEHVQIVFGKLWME